MPCHPPLTNKKGRRGTKVEFFVTIVEKQHTLLAIARSPQRGATIKTFEVFTLREERLEALRKNHDRKNGVGSERLAMIVNSGELEHVVVLKDLFETIKEIDELHVELVDGSMLT